MTTSKLIHAHCAGDNPADEWLSANENDMAAAALQALAPLVQSAKEHKVLSKMLAQMAGGRKKGLLKSILGGAGKFAGAFGFANQAQYLQKGGRGKKAARGSGGGGRGGGGGGITVMAGNAPIQFARTDEIANFFRMQSTKNGCVVHAAVQVSQNSYQWGTEGSIQGAFHVAVGEYVNPAKATYPWLSTFAALWKKFRVKNLRLHYQHYESTQVPGEVILKYTPDPDDALQGQEEAQICNGSNFVRGAIYEDFMLECDLSGAPKVPLDTDYTSSTDANDNALGQWSVFGNHFIDPNSTTEAATSTLPGNFYVEFVIEFNDRFVPAADLGLVRAVMKSSRHTREEKMAALGELLDREEEATRRAKEAVKPLDVVDELIKPKEKRQPRLKSAAVRAPRETVR
jgi:hypothetical protein